MGGKDSKPVFINYEEAVKRVSEAELRRLKDAFKRTSTLNGFMSRQFFVREVLGESVPAKLADRIYLAFGGTSRGIGFKELLCGLVVVTKGSTEERIKFLFGVYTSEQSYGYINQSEMDELVLQTEGHVPFELADLFLESDKVSYEKFLQWIGQHSDSLSMTRWLLKESKHLSVSSDLDTPTFYQTLAGVTHLEETDIIELEKQYWQLKALSKSGRFDLETFTSIVSPPIPLSLCTGLFAAFDENQDNHIDLKELACGVSACGRGPAVERQKFCFKVFDADRDGILSESELRHMIATMLAVRAENCPSLTQGPKAIQRLDDAEKSISASQHLTASDSLSVTQRRTTTQQLDDAVSGVDRTENSLSTIQCPNAIQQLDDAVSTTESAMIVEIINEIRSCNGDKEVGTDRTSSHGGGVTMDEYLVWTVNQTLPSHLLSLLAQVCHIVLGLRPQSKEDEKSVVIPWLAREEQHGLRIGQVWYLVSMAWWRQWLDYINIIPSVSSYTSHSIRLSSLAPSSVCPSSSSSVSSLSVGTGLQKLPAKTLSNHSRGSSISLCPGSGMLRRNSSACSSPDDGISLTSFTSHQQNERYTAGQSVRETDSQGQISASNSQASSPSGSPSSMRRAIGGLVRPGAIDNTSLVAPPTYNVGTLTNEGGCLRTDRPLLRGRDYEILPEPVWKAMSCWYGRSPIALPRTVILNRPGSPPELELYPVQVRLLRYQLNNITTRPVGGATATSTISGIGGVIYNSLGVAGITSGGGGGPTPPRRYLAYTSMFSRKHSLAQIYDFLTARLKIAREDMRLWKIGIDDMNMTLLDEDSESKTVEELEVVDGSQILIEVRNRDLTWPEELCQLAKNKALMDKTATERGATGLNNLGNTCFMNSALQCMSNTYPLTVYFTSGLHLYEINRSNPLGTHGDVAQRYGDLVKDLWSGTAKSIAPLKLRWTIGKHAPCFSGFQQHDSQELLAFVLDRLHEDLNRVHDKPYVELKDSDGRPDALVAHEAWENHLVRNQSIVVDLFHGQLKSCVKCNECGHTSVTFDPFTFLSLPLPMESCIHLEIIVVRMDESCPIKYGLRLSVDERYRGAKAQLSKLCNIPTTQLLLVDVLGPLVRSFPDDNAKIKLQQGGTLFVYELPPPAPITPLSAAEERALNTSLHSNSSLINHSSCATNIPNDHEVIGKTADRPPDHLPNGFARGLLGSSEAEDVSINQRGKESAVGQSINHVSPLHHRVPGGLSEIQRNTYAKQSNSTTSVTDSLERPPTATSATGSCGDSLSADVGGTCGGCVVAVHRKMVHMDIYFLSSHKCRPSLFGTPMILSCDNTTTNQNLYEQVWNLVARLVSPLPPIDHAALNHAQDCDDSLGYEYPFTLKSVQSDGLTCTFCPWYRFCRGCRIECSPNLQFNYSTSYVAVDWEPTALHLRYHASQEKVYVEDASVEASRIEHKESIGLDGCLKAFTKEEHLGEDELYYCSKCKEHKQAVKKLELWKLPPILIIHLKRFQFHNGRWVKSQKVVKFPLKDFDPTNYLVRRETTNNNSEAAECTTHSDTVQTDMADSDNDSKKNSVGNTGESSVEKLEIALEKFDKSSSETPAVTLGLSENCNVANFNTTLENFTNQNKHFNCHNKNSREADACSVSSIVVNDMTEVIVNSGTIEEKRGRANHNTYVGSRQCNTGSNLGCSCDNDDDRRNGSDCRHQRGRTKSRDEMKSTADATDEQPTVKQKLIVDEGDGQSVRYNLYAVSCHMGILGGGHYITYARNPNGKWYCYNDSSCKEVSEEHVDTDTAYMLFYEQQGLDRSKFMPDVSGRDPHALDSNDEELDKELKKFCVIQ